MHGHTETYCFYAGNYGMEKAVWVLDSSVAGTNSTLILNLGWKHIRDKHLQTGFYV